MVKIVLGGIEIMPKVLNSNFICILRKFPGFFQDILIFPFSFLQDFSRIIFSFSTFSRVRGNPDIFLFSWDLTTTK